MSRETFEEQFPSLKGKQFCHECEDYLESANTYHKKDIEQHCFDKQIVRKAISKIITESKNLQQDFKAGKLVALSELMKELGL